MVDYFPYIAGAYLAAAIFLGALIFTFVRDFLAAKKLHKHDEA